MHFVVSSSRGQRIPMAMQMCALLKVACQRLSALLAYLMPAQRPSARMKHCLGLHGLQRVAEPTDRVVVQQLAAAKHGGFSQHSWGWQKTGHVTRKNSVKL
jgi:hypothetical protein